MKRTHLSVLILSALGAALLPGAVIPPAVVKQDVFGPRNFVAQEVEDPIEGRQLWFSFDGFQDFNYEIRSTGDLSIWASRGFKVATGGSGLFVEPFPPVDRRFYQATIAGSGDATPPDWPPPASGSRFQAINVESHSLDLEWPAATDDTAVVAYALYLDGAHLATLDPTDLGTFVQNLEPGTEYELDLFACDPGANCTQYPISLVVRTRNLQEPYLNAPRGQSVYLSSGEFSLRRTDLAIPARELGFVFTRTYRSDFERSGPLGYGWTANIFERLRERKNGDVVWLQGIGRADTFSAQPGGDYLAPPGIFKTLTKSASGFQLVSADGSTRSFDPAGKIEEITTRNGNSLTYNRTGSQLTSLTDDMGRETMLIYGADDRIERIVDFTGREVRYTYDAHGNLISARSPVVIGTPNGNDFPAGKTERYLYDTANPDPDLAHNLLAAIAPNEVADGSLTPSLVLTYGTAGPFHDRLLTETAGGTNAGGVPAGGTTTYNYSTLAGGLVAETAVTDPRGNVVRHLFGPTGHRNVLIEVLAGRPNPVTTFTYDAEGNLLTATHPEGNDTTYTYDSAHLSRRSQGNLLRVTHAPGPRGGDQPQLVTTYTYDPIYNRVRSTTDPRGNTWTHRFDFEEACDFGAIGTKVGLSAPEAQSLLQSAGLCTGGPAGDLNGDALTNQHSGNVIRRDHPTASLGPNQAALEGDPAQEIVEYFAYNNFGQRLFTLDPEENTTRFRYYPETDPDGDGTPNNPAGDPSTGGYLRQVEADAEPLPATRNSGGGAPPVQAFAEFAYNPRGALTRRIDGRGVATDFIRNNLDETVRTLRGAASGVLSVPLDPPEPLALSPFQYFRDTHYDANGNVVRTEVEDRGDTSATGGAIDSLFDYDILDRLVQTSREVGGGAPDITTRYRYDPNGNRVLSILPEGNATSAVYEERNLPLAVTRGTITPPAEALLAAFDPAHFDVRGGAESTVTFHYDDNRNRDRIEDASDTDGSAANNGISGGDRSTFQYDGYDRPVRTIDSVGNVATRIYDPNSNVVSTERFGPDGGATPLDDTPSGNLLASASYEYDAVNRLVRSAQALFANAGAPDIQEGATDLGKGNLLPGDSAINALFEYDRLGRRTFVVQDDQDTSSFQYDGLGRLIRSTDPIGNTVEFAYDDNSNLIENREIDVATVPGVADEIFLTTYSYDSLNRLASRVDNLGHSASYEYDSRDNPVAVADPNGPPGPTINRRAFPDGPMTVNGINLPGNVTTYAYDGLDRQVRTARILTASGFGDGSFAPPPDPAQGGGDGLITTEIHFDNNSLINGRGDDWGFETRFEYDNLNRVVTETRGICPPGGPPGGYNCPPPTKIQSDWDLDDNLVRTVDEIGSVLSYTYDGINRPVSVNVTRGPGVAGTTAQTYEYDGLGRVTHATDDNGDAALRAVETRSTYDSLSRVVSERLLPAPASAPAVTTHAWRAEGLRANTGYPGGRVVEYTYDDLDRLNTVADAGAALPIAAHGYIGASRPLVTHYPQNGTRHTFLDNAGTTDIGYDGIRRPIRVRDLDLANNLITGFAHGYDRSANRLGEQKLHDAPNNENYQYDSAYRLTGINRLTLGAAPLLHRNFTIDGNNNWQAVDAETRAHSSFNEITLRQPGSLAITSDDNGNVSDDGTGTTYRWDAFDRLVTVRQGGVPVARYTYDAAGRRVRKENSNLPATLVGITEYLHAGAHVIEERDGVGVPQRQFVYGPGVDNPLRMDDLVTGDGFFFHKNTLGSAFALTDAASGAVVERMLYDAYGNPGVTQIGGATPSGNPYLFTGRRFDPATGNYYYRSRYLDPVQGRFLGRDSLGIWGDPANAGNAYAYCANNPINCTDPSGRAPLADLQFLTVDISMLSYTDVNADAHVSPLDALRVRDRGGVQDHVGNAHSLVINLSLGWEAGYRGTISVPDVCKTPAPGGPIPIPYPNTGQTSSAIEYARCRGSLAFTATDDLWKFSEVSGLGRELAGNDNEWRNRRGILTGTSVATAAAASAAWNAHDSSEAAWTDMRPLSFAPLQPAEFFRPEVGDEVLGFYDKGNKAAGTRFSMGDGSVRSLHGYGTVNGLGINRPDFGSGLTPARSATNIESGTVLF